MQLPWIEKGLTFSVIPSNDGVYVIATIINDTSWCTRVYVKRYPSVQRAMGLKDKVEVLSPTIDNILSSKYWVDVSLPVFNPFYGA